MVFWVLTFIGTPCILLYNTSVGFHLLDYIVSQLRRPLYCCINFKFYAKNFVVRIWYVEALYYIEVNINFLICIVFVRLGLIMAVNYLRLLSSAVWHWLVCERIVAKVLEEPAVSIFRMMEERRFLRNFICLQNNMASHSRRVQF